MPAKATTCRVSGSLAPNRLFFHVFFNRHFRQRASLGAAVAPDAPLFDPLFLHIGLAAGGTHKHAFFIEHSTLFLHDSLFSKIRLEDGTILAGIARTTAGSRARQDVPGTHS
jgi:hypothetical protein